MLGEVRAGLSRIPLVTHRLSICTFVHTCPCLLIMKCLKVVTSAVKSLAVWNKAQERVKISSEAGQPILAGFPFATGGYFDLAASIRKPNWSNKNAHTSAPSSTCSSRLESIPCPVVELVRKSIGAFELVAACSRAVIFREFAGFTRGSFAPVRNNTPG